MVCCLFFISCAENEICEPSSDEWSVIQASEVILSDIWLGDDCTYAVGGSIGIETSEISGTVLKNVNGAWEVEKNEWDSRVVLTTLQGNSCDEIYAIGYVHEAGTYSGILMKKNGNKWTMHNYGREFSSLQIIEDDVYLAATDGGVFRLDGNSLERLHSINIKITDLWGTDANNLFISGFFQNRSSLMHFDGSDWTDLLVSSRIKEMYINLFLPVAENEIYAAGEDGKLVKYDGERWSILTSGLPPIYDIAVSSAKEIYLATGRYPNLGAIYKYVPNTRELIMEFSLSSPVTGIWSDESRGIYACTGSGKIIHKSRM